MKTYSKPVSESIDLRSVGRLMGGLMDASGESHAAPAPKKKGMKSF